jgi:predicted nucleotidyltransferase
MPARRVDSPGGPTYLAAIESASPTRAGLPPLVEQALQEFLTAARDALGDDLHAAVLYGSAAEGALRPTSDVNLILVLGAFDPARVERLREPYRTARAAIGLAVMYLLESEIEAAASAFAVKFADVAHRRRVLVGRDPFATLVVPRAARVSRLRQVLLNLALRLRDVYVRSGGHEERLAAAVADAVGPLRASAAALLELEGEPSRAPKEAFARVARDLLGADADAVLAHLSAAREHPLSGTGTAGPTLLALIDLTQRLRARANRLEVAP